MNLRMPADLKARLQKQADDNNRSLTAEITSRLEHSLATPQEIRSVELKAALAIIENFTTNARQYLAQGKARKLIEENPELEGILGLAKDRDGGK